MQFTAAQIAALIQGTVDGNPDTAVNSFGKIEIATEGQLSFLANPKYEAYIYQTKASIVIVQSNFKPSQPIQSCLVRVNDPYSAFATLLRTYEQMQAAQLKGIEQPVHIAATAKVDQEVYVGAFAYIGENASVGKGSKIHNHVSIGRNVVIGERVVLHPHVVIYNDCVIGNNVVIHAGSIIGSDGFGFAPQADGSYQKVPQMGNVVIEDQVEIGANTAIDRATIGSTIIKKGVKLDNLIQIAHNAQIGENTVIAAQTGISGSTHIGKGVMVGGQVGFAGHIKVADGTKITAQSGITKSVNQPNSILNGTPAQEHQKSLRNLAAIRNLSQLEQRVAELEQKLKEIQNK